MKRAFFRILSIILVLYSWSIQGVHYIIQDLGTLASEESYATGINNQNVVVGYFKHAGIKNNFIWKAHNLELSYLPHTGTIQDPLINNHNQVANIFWQETNNWFTSNYLSKHIYIYSNDSIMEDIGFPSGWKLYKLSSFLKPPSSYQEKDLKIIAFNDQQQILIANSTDINKANHFAIWHNGVFKELDLQMLNRAYAMNNQGVILGRIWKQTESGTVPMLVLYDSVEGTITEIMRDINILHRKLNDKGQVLIFQGSSLDFKSFLWSAHEGFIDLGDFAPTCFNNCNQIVGCRISELKKNLELPSSLRNKAIPLLLWTPKEVIPLSPFLRLNSIDSIYTEVLSLDAINDNGYIIGSGLADGKKHAFVLIPQE